MSDREMRALSERLKRELHESSGATARAEAVAAELRKELEAIAPPSGGVSPVNLKKPCGGADDDASAAAIAPAAAVAKR